ncbi:hypothetical protein KAT92_04895, partial [Candidatus Babeliales bacterium]|nr:hypothetical protein [Candidatus Babeliales bacterium]
MTYDVLEKSTDSGEPVELYEFLYQSRAYRHTSHSENLTHIDTLYTAISISRSGISQTQESAKNNITLTIDRREDVVQLFVDRPPSDVVRVSIIRKHVGDDGFAVVWTGRVLNVEIKGLQAELHCEPIFTSIKRPGTRRHWQRA